MEGGVRNAATFPRLRRRRGLDAAVCAILLLVSLAAYLRTLRPTFGWGDSSELITAAYYLGVGHAPGYPTWMLIAHPFAHLPFGDVAFRVNFMTALLGAVGVALLYLVYRVVAGDRFAAFIGALTFAFSATFWDQTTEAEVYTLHICLAAVILLILLSWRAAQKDRWLYLLAWVIGISLGNHALTGLMIPPVLYLVWAQRGRRFFTLRRVSVCAGLFLLGLSIYAYEPIRALDNPPPHLNNPHNLIEFWAQLTAPGARHAMFDRGLLVTLERARIHTGRLLAEFGYAGCAVALFGIGALWRRDRRLALFLALIALFNVAYSVNFSIFDIYVYYLPLHLVWAAFIAVGAADVMRLAGALLSRTVRTLQAASPARRCAPAAILLMALPMVQFATHLPIVDGSRDYGSERFARAVFSNVEPGSLVLADWWTIAPLGYLKYIEGERQDVVMFAAPSIHCEEGFVNFAQEDFLRRYPAVYFVEMLTYRANLLRERAYMVPEGPIFRVLLDRPDPESLLADIPAKPITRFGGRIGLVGAEVAAGSLRPGQCLDFTLYWTPLSGFNGKDHQAILVLESADHDRIWQESNVLGYDLYRLDQWKSGEVLTEKHRIYLPDPVPTGEYDLLVRVRERGTAKCLQCDRPAAEHERDYRIATIPVGEPEPIPSENRIPALVAQLRP